MSNQAVNLVKKHRVGSPTKKSVLLALADYADTDWSTFAGQDRIAAETELSVRTVRTALADLEEAGLITRRIRHRRRGRGRTSDYTTLQVAAIARLPLIEHPVDNPTTNRQELPVEASTNRQLTTTNRQLSPDQPAAAAGEPSEEPLEEPETNRQELPVERFDPVDNHIHEFEVIPGPPDREYRACRHCGVGPQASRTLGVDL